MINPPAQLRVASSFSAHYGVTRPEQLVAAAKSAGFDAAAITDRNGLYGAVKHLVACQKNRIDPIVGVEIRVVMATQEIDLGYITLLAHGFNRGAGWAALCRSISRAHQHGSKAKVPRIELSELAEICHQPAGSVATLMIGPDSTLGTLALENPTQASLVATQILEIFPSDALAIAVHSHLTEPGTRFSLEHARALIELAEWMKVPAVITNAVRYLDPADAVTADVLDSARTLEPLGIFQPQANAQAWLKPPNLMATLALEITEHPVKATELLKATRTLTDKCRLDPESDCGFGTPKTPEISALGITENPFEVLWQRSHAAIALRYPRAKAKELTEIQHRLSQELIAINQLGFSTYFLTVADVVAMIRDMKIRIAARGSGAGSLVNYLLHISNVDPISNQLLFERFLSTERSTLPDIDIDVESARRHDIYRSIFRRYGGDRVTLLSMQNTYRGRGAVRDSGLALGLDPDEIDSIAKNMWRFSARNFRSALGKKPELAELAEAAEQDRKLNLLIDLTERLDRLPRHISMHPCGVILGNTNLLNLTPTEPSGLGLPMSQFDKDDMDPMGFLKLDVLGVRMQSTMAFAVEQIRVNRQLDIQLDEVAQDDPEVFRMLRTTNTLGVFQIESPGQRELTGKHQPTVFNDLTLQISLFRPGPMKGNMISPYLDGRHGFIQPDYLHPDLKPVLEESYGVVVFHEQLMRIMKIMTGCTLARADELRRSLSKPQLSLEIERFFRSAAAARGYPEQLISKVWSIIEGFGSFGFCKAHGAAFAVPTYQSAWLKTHYPTEFIAGLLTHDPGMYPRRLLVAEARRLGVPLLPMDVNFSRRDYVVERDEFDNYGVRMALVDVKNISEPELKRILHEQPFTDLLDFYLRARPSRRTMLHLAQLGALDTIAGISKADAVHSRGDVIAKVREMTARVPKKQPEGQLSFDFDSLVQLPIGNQAPSKKETVAVELELTGLDISGHQLDEFAPMLEAMGAIKANELVNLRGNTEVLVAGVRVATQTPPMRTGKRVVFITLDDGTGCSDITFFDEAQQRTSHLLFHDNLLLIAGKTRRTGARGVSILAENAWNLRQLWSNWSSAKALGDS